MSKLRLALIMIALCSGPMAAAQSGLFNFSNPAANISILALPMAEPPRYSGGFDCRFRVRTYENSKRTSEREFSITTASVGERILITHGKAGGVSSILLATDGRLIDFNVPSGAGTRTTRDSAERAPFYRDAPTYLHPYFPAIGDVLPDSLYGEIVGPGKEPEARLLYLGKVAFSRPTVYVFDIMGLERTRETPNGFPLGRITIDSGDGLPRILVLGSSTRIQYERLTCSEGR